ncbi:hypothetical protein SAMN02745157_2412 [Kaistia soli DSM 19436]|uniref:Uncharacterized protein n=1 Tax=Kaistia soli DSM 19436 TaxID=1122133 RepID=A0A1M5CPK2_9HYPH|nr:hypothetical protein [Kaistia soli]SHF56322.1 hypothetical protein SAMN02745157_2412 [Kaistia soli DSM 19436]
MSTPVMPVVPLVDLDEAAEVNQPQPDSERARELRKKRDDAIAEGDLPPPDIAGLSEQAPAGKTKP